MINPYSGTTFFEFFAVMFGRVVAFLTGTAEALFFPDEVQILVLVLIAVASAMTGAFLIFRRMAMLANSLSHTILPGVVFAFLGQKFFFPESLHGDLAHALPSGALLVISACVMAFLTTFLTETATRLLRVHADASTGIVFTFLFAVGVILVTVTSRNAHIGADLLMGNVDALQASDLDFVFWIALVNVIIFYIFLRGFVVTTFDPIFSKVMGLSPAFFGYLLMFQTAITSVAAFRAVGVLMFLAFLVAPPLIARLWTKDVYRQLSLALFVGAGCSVAAVALSRHLLTVFDLALSTSGLVVCLLGLVYLISLLVVFRKKTLLLSQEKEV